MQTFLTAEEILQLVTTGVVELTDELMIRMTESYEDSDWYNDPNNVMSHHHYWWLNLYILSGKLLLLSGIFIVLMNVQN